MNDNPLADVQQRIFNALVARGITPKWKVITEGMKPVVVVDEKGESAYAEEYIKAFRSVAPTKS